MSLKKKLIVAAAVSAMTAATALPAMALENEFHGMYLVGGFISNGYNSGTGAVLLGKDAKTNNFVDQRARIMYTAKASDDLKLVTHFELDTKWGGRTLGKYTNQTDAGGADADGINLETKNVYLDFNIPKIPVNAKVGIQPWADAYKSTFGFIDDTGVALTGKFGPATAGLGWFRITDASGALDGVSTSAPTLSGKQTVDLLALDGKFAVTKDVTVGANYYLLLRDTGTTGGASGVAEFVNTIGANAAAKFGPAAVDAFFGYQFGDYDKTRSQKLSAFGAGATGKFAAGPGTASLALLYLSGEKTPGTGTQNNWQFISANQTYFNDANMWFLVRNPASLNTSAAIGSNDLTKGGRGLLGIFAGYNGAVDKVLFGVNAGWAQVNEKRTGETKTNLGTELNGMVGYKLYDNLTAKFNVAYCILGDGAKKATGGLVGITGGSAAGDADNPYLTNLMLQYTF